MRSNDGLEEAIDFILNEAIRFGQMDWEALKLVLQENAFCELNDAEGRKRIVGRKAYDLMRDLTDEARDVSPYSGRIGFERAFKAVRDVLGKRYIRRDIKVIDGEQVARDLADAMAEAGAECADRTYYLPCSVTVPKNKALRIGPVSIRPAKDMVAELGPRLEAQGRAEAAEVPGSTRDHISPIRDYYLAFPDVAEIRIPGCDKPTSKELAFSVVQTALNLLHVMVGAGFSEKLVLGGPSLARDLRGMIVGLDDGSMELITSRHFLGGVNAADEWWESLLGGEQAANLHRFGAVLTALVKRHEPGLLGRKFSEACAWYGDAAKEQSRAAAVVKYLTAMEVLLWADDARYGTTKRLAARAAALCFSTTTWDLFELETKIEEAYDVRSGIVHGRLGATDPRVRKSLRLCERISRDLMLTWLDRFSAGFTSDLTMDRLRDYLDDFVRQAKQACEAAKSGQADPDRSA